MRTSRYEVSCGGVFTVFRSARGAVWWSFDAGGKCDPLSLFHPTSGCKRTKTRCRDESYSLCPAVLFRATFRSRKVSCRVSEPRAAAPITAVPLAFPVFSRENISTIAFVEVHAAALLFAITDYKYLLSSACCRTSNATLLRATVPVKISVARD